MKDLLRLNFLLKHVIDVYVRAASAEAGPPLGTILGNMGVNASKFAKEFNDFTKNLPTYFIVKARIFIYDNRTTSFLIFSLSTTFLSKILRFEKIIKVFFFDRFHEKTLYCVNVKELIRIAIFRFPNIIVATSFITVVGTINSTYLKIIIS